MKRETRINELGMTEHVTTFDDGSQHVHIDPGNKVVCDSCAKDFTESEETGGILFQSKAIGPCCMKRWLEGAVAHGEERFIRGRCPEGKPFADWVREDVR